MKKLIGVIVALIFVMLVFLPVVDNHTIANVSNSSNIKTDVANNNINPLQENNNLHWININMNNTGYNIKNATGSYAISGNREYIKTEVTSNIPDKYQNKVSVIMGRGFETVLKTEINAVSVFTVISTHGNLNNFINQNSTLIISNGKISMEKINDPTAHKSFGWGQAWVVSESVTFCNSVGGNDFNEISALIGGVASIMDGFAVGVLVSALVGAVAGALTVVVAAALYTWVNMHETSNGNYIPYATIGFSEGKWWDPWDTGAYGEIGAYSNQAFTFTGKQTYSGQYLYFPLVSVVDASPTVSGPHSSIWPNVCPPW